MYAASRFVHANHPVLVVETAASQSATSMLNNLVTWVIPWPGGGGAEIAVGFDITRSSGSRLKFDVYMAISGQTNAQLLMQCGDGTGCTQGGNPRYFLWLPLYKLMPGSWLLARLCCSVMIAVGGFIMGLVAFFQVPPWKALERALHRLLAPWGAVSVDMYEVKRALQIAR